MRRALAEAETGRGAVEPNPMVGAVVVRDGRPIGIGHHERFGGPHAEVVALDRPARRPSRRDALRDARAVLPSRQDAAVHRRDPRGRDRPGRGGRRRSLSPGSPAAAWRPSRPRASRVEVGCEADAARELNAPYWKRLTTGRPYVTAKWAMTLDGKTAVASGDSRWISSDESRRRVHELRGRMDAILVGIGTVEADDPRLTVRPPGPRRPVRIVLDSSARLATGHRARPDRVRRPRPRRRDRPRPGRSTRPARRRRLRGARPSREPARSRSASCSTNSDAAG